MNLFICVFEITVLNYLKFCEVSDWLVCGSIQIMVSYLLVSKLSSSRGCVLIIHRASATCQVIFIYLASCWWSCCWRTMVGATPTTGVIIFIAFFRLILKVLPSIFLVEKHDKLHSQLIILFWKIYHFLAIYVTKYWLIFCYI